MAVFGLSDFKLHVSPSEFITEFAQWLVFGCFGRPDINGMENSWTLIAGVNWSLRFEWLFYVMGLPAIFMLARVASRNSFLIGSSLALGAAVATAQFRGGLQGSPLYLIHFLCGVTSAFIYENASCRSLISSLPFYGIGALSLAVLGFMPDSGNASAVVASTLFFLAILGGFNFFKVLTSRSAIWLGDLSYGIYLVHGIVLWLTFYICKRFGFLDGIDSPIFVALLPTMGAIVMITATVSFLYLEKPMIEIGRKLARSLEMQKYPSRVH